MIIENFYVYMEVIMAIEDNLRKPCEEENDIGCSEKCYMDISVGIPITIKPFGKLGNAKTQCLESSVVFDDIPECNQSKEQSCRLIVVQKLRVEIPVVFGANVEAEEIFVDCGNDEPHCNCKDI